MSTSLNPKVGDIWEVRIPGKRKKVKEVGRVTWNWFYTYDKNGNQTSHTKRPCVKWKRLPKGRYTGMWIDVLQKYGNRMSTKAERDEAMKKRWKEKGLI